MMLPWQVRTASTHPYRLDDVAALSDNLHRAASAALPPQARIALIFVVPADVYSNGIFGWRYVSEQALIFTDGGVLHVQEDRDQRGAANATYIEHDCLLYVRSSQCLLHGRLEFAACSDQTLARVIVEYNTVGWKLLERALLYFVRSSAGVGLALAASPADLSHREAQLNALPFKLANGLRYYALDQAELLRGAIFQPAIWARRWGILQRQVTASAVLALTDRQVIVVEEERTVLRKSAQRGWVVTHIPLPAIHSLQMAAQPPWQVFTIGMGRGGQVAERKITLEHHAAHRWSELWQANVMSVVGA